MAETSAEISPRPNAPERATTTLALSALGIVFGDLGTSPLYTLQTVVGVFSGKFTSETALGILSLIFWTLAITISLKYCVLVMRADNNGEGGILALMSVVGADWHGRGRILIMMGLFGAALLYGDGIITPAMSVLSALEGLNVATSFFQPHIVPMAVAILLGLFLIQRRGTARIGRFFGPVMLLWFIVIALLGLGGIMRHPRVLMAISPQYALALLAHAGWGSFAILGGIFLAITGGEALYADMGHFGRNPIRSSWYAIVLPALLLNYAGQTALLLDHSTSHGNPFFDLAPRSLIYPLVILATVAAIIASQAIITGSFSLTRQAMQLGWFPGLRIRQTSADQYGQIYVPFVNWIMMILTIALTISFGSSSSLAGAYGTAVSTTMLLTTVLLYNVMRERWQWPAYFALLASAGLLFVDFAFFAANLLKIADGGWIPLSMGVILFIVMTTWRAGIEAVHDRYASLAEPPEQFLKRLQERKIPRVPGAAIFLTRIQKGMPSVIIQQFNVMGALHQTLVALTVSFENVPRIPTNDRLKIVQRLDGFLHVAVSYGFVEVPDLPAALRDGRKLGVPLDLNQAIYFAERDEVIRGTDHVRLWKWQLALFDFLYRNSVRPVDLFNLPPANYVQVGREIEI